MEFLLSDTDLFDQCVKKLNRMIVPTITHPVEAQIIDVSVTTKEQQERQIPHHHSYFEVHFPIRNQLNYCFGDFTNGVEKDQYIVIAPGVEHHRVTPDPSVLKFSFGIKLPLRSNDKYTALLRKILSEQNYFVSRQRKEMKRIIGNILAECEKPTFFSPYIIRDHLVCLLIEICNDCDTASAEFQLPQQLITDHRIEKAKQFIQDNLHLPLRTATVASHVYISSRQLNRIFTEQTGISVSKYISNAKVAKAGELLSSTDHRIKKIAYTVGFENESTFSVFFKKATKLSPVDYRKKHKIF